MANATYKESGVDLELYAQAMQKLPRLLKRTFCPRVMPLEGGFAGLFQLDFPGSIFARKYEQPVLVSCTDGVGTKLKVAQKAGRFDTVGIDLVAMCVNDALCLGAEPLFFLDYVALSHDDPPLLEQLVSGVSNGCVESDCALMGGETAILPDIYARGDFDMAGFCVGVVEKKRIIDGSQISVDDEVIGLASTGIHSNGFSLVRKVVFEIAGLDVKDHVEELGTNVGEALLTPTRIYARALRRILNNYKVKHVVHAIAHITGGGLHENLARVIPEGKSAVIQRESWPVPSVFPWLKKLGGIDEEEMDRVFNMGIGMALVVSPFFAESIRNQLAHSGITSWSIGRITSGESRVVWG